MLRLADLGGREIPSGELAHGFMQHLRAPPEQGFSLTERDSLGWRILEATLRKAMRAGMNPAMLAFKIDLLVLG
jgi:hypothetical protein